MKNDGADCRPILRRATAGDVPAVLGLYRSALGTPGCAWDDEYPNEYIAERDLQSGGLCVYADARGIAGAVSVESENELDDIFAWRVCDGTHCEIARVVVAPDRRGRGYAAEMLRGLFGILASRGFRAVHLIVSKSNPAAIKTYRALGFDFLGECHMYGTDFYICEKLLGSDDCDEKADG